MKYLNESFGDFLNEMALSPEEKKARRKERRAAKKTGTKLPKLNSKNKAAQMTPDELMAAIKNASPSYRIEWDHWGNSFTGETEDRGPRTDHGGGEDGEEWMSSAQQQREFAPYMKKWAPKAKEMQNALLKQGIIAHVSPHWGEKGHIYLEVTIKQ